MEVVLLSRNSPETGLRVFRSIDHYGLDITRAAFMSGRSPYEYIPAFNASLFLSAHEEDVQRAIDADYPAGLVLPTRIYDDEIDTELRVAFDFDGVIADDEAESVYKQHHDLDEFLAHERDRKAIPISRARWRTSTASSRTSAPWRTRNWPSVRITSASCASPSSPRATRRPTSGW